MQTHRTELVGLALASLLIVTSCQTGPAVPPLPTATYPPPALISPSLPPPTQPPPTPVPLAQVVHAGVDPLNTGNIESALAFWADDATVKLVGVPPDMQDTYQGKDQIRGWFQSLVAQHFAIQVEPQKEDVDTVTTKTQTWSDQTRQLGVAPLVATEVYVVQEGMIKGLTWTISPESLAKVQAASAPKATPQSTAAPPPTATFEPEVLANQIADVAGVWRGKDPPTGLPTLFEIQPDGRYAVRYEGGDLIDQGVLSIKASTLSFETAEHFCILTPTASYEVYTAKQGGRSVQLRLHLAGNDPCIERKAFMLTNAFRLVEP